MAVHALAIDPVHTAVEFAVTYAMNSIVKGRFLDVGGTITLDADDPTRSSVSAYAGSASVWTNAERRDGDLKSGNFFDVENHERLTFESGSIEVVEDNHWLVHGDLTMLGHTRPVTLDTHYYGIVEDAMGNTRAGFVAETDIQRSDWGMTWNAEQETGVLISNRVRLSLYVSAKPVVTAEGGNDDNGDASDGEDVSEE